MPEPQVHGELRGVWPMPDWVRFVKSGFGWELSSAFGCSVDFVAAPLTRGADVLIALSWDKVSHSSSLFAARFGTEARKFLQKQLALRIDHQSRGHVPEAR
jgi:hypothetical protein